MYRFYKEKIGQNSFNRHKHKSEKKTSFLKKNGPEKKRWKKTWKKTKKTEPFFFSRITT